jgi:hypothetical protein
MPQDIKKSEPVKKAVMPAKKAAVPVKKETVAERLNKVNPVSKAKYEAAMQKQWKSRPENQANNFKPSLKKAVELPMTKKAKASNMKIK